MERAYGAAALAPTFAIVSIHAPFCYLIGITVMEFARADGRGLPDTLRIVARTIIRNAPDDRPCHRLRRQPRRHPRSPARSAPPST